MDDAAVGALAVFADVGCFHDLVVAREFEDVGVHHEDEDVACEADFEFEVAAVAELEVDFGVGVVVGFLELACDFLGGGAEGLVGVECGVIDLLFEVAFVKDEVFEVFFKLHICSVFVSKY